MDINHSEETVETSSIVLYSAFLLRSMITRRNFYCCDLANRNWYILAYLINTIVRGVRYLGGQYNSLKRIVFSGRDKKKKKQQITILSFLTVQSAR